jgi:phage repressor protein C with HTH and peptisase S24 domain
LNQNGLNVNQLILESINPKYPPRTFEGDFRESIKIVGKVIAQIRKRG